MAPHRQATDACTLIGLKIRHADPKTKHHPLQRPRRHVVCKFQSCYVRRIHPRAQAVPRMHHHIGRVFHPRRNAPQGVRQKHRNIQRGCRIIHLPRLKPFPADRAQRTALWHRFRQPIPQPPPVTRLRWQRQAGTVAGANIAHRHQRRNLGIGKAFIACQQQRIIGRDNQHRLFKPWVKPGQPVHVRRVFAVAVNHRSAVTPHGNSPPERRQPPPHFRQCQRGRHIRRPKIGPVDTDQTRSHANLPLCFPNDYAIPRHHTCAFTTPPLYHWVRGWRGQVPRQPGQVRKEAAATRPTWVVFSLSPQSVADKSGHRFCHPPRERNAAGDCRWIRNRAFGPSVDRHPNTK